MDFLVQPRLNSLQNGTTYNFNFTLNSSYWSVTKYGFTMFNGSGQVLGYNESTSFSSPPTLNLFTGENASIRMEYFWWLQGIIPMEQDNGKVLTMVYITIGIMLLFNFAGLNTTTGTVLKSLSIGSVEDIVNFQTTSFYGLFVFVMGRTSNHCRCCFDFLW